jgi:glutathione S-transferase
MPPILYSFRRCPYAMRARLALHVAGGPVALREVVLRDKPAAFLAASDSATVPCLVDVAHSIDESLDVMIWALKRNDPEGWLNMPSEGHEWIARCDGPFKHALDRTKYAVRYPDQNPVDARDQAMAFLHDLEKQLGVWIFEHATLADYAILPFVRQFAFIDKPRFDAEPLPRVHAWLRVFLNTQRFADIMHKYPQWHAGDAEVLFP